MEQRQNKQKNMAWKTAAVLFCLCLISLWALSGTLAKYVSSDTAGEKARAASVVFHVKDQDGVKSLDLTSELALAGLQPGQKKTLPFSVVNYEGSAISETAMEYTISIETTGNLPLTYSLQADSGGLDSPAASPSEKATWSGGKLPAAAKETHFHTLTVQWPSDKNSAEYSAEIDSVYLNVEAVQKTPGA